MKADEVRLYALRGGLKKQSVCYTHFHSNEVFRGDLMSFSVIRIDAGLYEFFPFRFQCEFLLALYLFMH